LFKRCFSFAILFFFFSDSKSPPATISQHVIDDILIPVLKSIYHYFQHEIKSERRIEIYKELEDRECIYSRTRRQFLQAKYFCLNLPITDEIPPFIFSLDNEFHEYKEFFLQIGTQAEPHPMLYGDILRKLSKVCEQDYLNSNELCKSLKAMECFFKYLATSSTVNSQTKLPGKRYILATLRYRVLSEDSHESSIFSLQLLLALGRRPAWRIALPLDHLSYILTKCKDRCLSHVISMHLMGDPRQTDVSDSAKFMPYLMVPRFE
jgi:hypothetical protein